VKDVPRAWIPAWAVGLLILPLMLLAEEGSPDSNAGREGLKESLRRAAQLEREGRWEEARERYLDIGRDHPRDRNVLNGLERAHRHVEDDGRYLGFLRENFRLHPQDRLLFVHYVAQSVEAGRSALLGEDVRLHRKNGKQDEGMYRGLYAILMQHDLSDLAEETLREGEKVLGDSLLFARELGDLHFMRGDYEQALIETLNILARSPASIAFVKDRLDALETLLTREEVAEEAQKIADRVDKPAPFLILLSGLYAESREMKRALGILERLSLVDPEGARKALAAFAANSEAARSYETGIDAYRLLIDLDPSGRAGYELEIARLYRAIGEPVQAGRLYQDLLSGKPDPETRQNALLALGEIALYDRHRPEDAVTWFIEAREIGFGTEAHARAMLGQIEALIYAGDIGGAEKAVEEAAAQKLAPDLMGEIRFFQGALALLAGQIEEGAAILEEISRQGSHPRANDAIETRLWLNQDASPDLAMMRGLLEYRLISGIGDTDRSLGILDRLVESGASGPLAPDVLYYRAKVQRQARRYLQAIEGLEAFVSGNPEHRLAAASEWEMADIYRRDLADLESAAIHFERLILNYEESVMAPRARRALEEIEKGTVPAGS